jgi:hypothetical protein
MIVKQIIHYSLVYLLLFHLVSFALFGQLVSATEHTSSSAVIHGGGNASIGCPDGSTVNTVVSFVAEKLANGTIVGNWTMESKEGMSESNNGLAQGPIYQGYLSTEYFNVQGETFNPQEQINICASPNFAPISLTGQCGQDVIVNIQFQSNDPLDTPDSFSADVECQYG